MFKGVKDPAATCWLDMLRHYLQFIALTNLVWETLHLPLYTIWAEDSMPAQAFAVVHCTGGDLIIATTTLMLALLLAGDNAWPARRFHRIAALATSGLRDIYGCCAVIDEFPARQRQVPDPHVFMENN